MRNKNRTSNLLVLNCLSGYGRLFFECSHIYELITDYSHCTGAYHVDHRVLLKNMVDKMMSPPSTSEAY